MLHFFSDRSISRREPRPLEYTASIGVTLYHELAREADGKDDWFSNAYREMGNSFGQAVMVLRSMSPAFRYKQEIATEAKRKGLLFPTDSRIGETAKIVSQFDGMYLVQPEAGESKTLN
jgi:hypothetical protein